MKRRLIVLGLASGALALIAWTQPWFGLELTDGQSLDIAGQVAVPALSALGLATLALNAALSIAGRVIRIVLGVLQVAIGAAIIATAVTALADPVAASARTVTDATGLSGAESIAALVASVTTTVWPVLTIVIGGIVALGGIAVVLTSRHWPGPTKRFETSPVEATPATGSDSKAGAWDTLSGGGDPT